MKVKRLYTIGDSWTYGHDLENPKEQSWPTLLSREFDCELIDAEKRIYFFSACVYSARLTSSAMAIQASASAIRWRSSARSAG